MYLFKYNVIYIYLIIFTFFELNLDFVYTQPTELILFGQVDRTTYNFTTISLPNLDIINIPITHEFNANQELIKVIGLDENDNYLVLSITTTDYQYYYYSILTMDQKNGTIINMGENIKVNILQIYHIDGHQPYYDTELNLLFFTALCPKLYNNIYILDFNKLDYQMFNLSSLGISNIEDMTAYDPINKTYYIIGKSIEPTTTSYFVSYDMSQQKIINMIDIPYTYLAGYVSQLTYTNGNIYSLISYESILFGLELFSIKGNSTSEVNLTNTSPHTIYWTMKNYLMLFITQIDETQWFYIIDLNGYNVTQTVKIPTNQIILFNIPSWIK